jgi:hypothetical protein
VADYLGRYGPTIRRVGEQQAAAGPWPNGVAAQLDAAMRAIVPAEKLGAATAWRDRRLMALAAHKRDQDKKTPRPK